MRENFSRLLVATEFPPNAPGGGAAVVRQMLRDWPTDRIFWWSCLPERRATFGQHVASLRAAKIPERLYPHRRARAAKSWILQHVWSRWASRHLQRTIERVQPDVAWLIPHAWSIPPLAGVFTTNTVRCHVSIHDYADAHGYVERFGEHTALAMAAGADRLYANAMTRDAISEPMADDLHARTSRQGAVLHAGVEESEFENFSKAIPDDTEVIRIAYAGTVVVEKTFHMIVDALKRIHTRIPQVSLEFFTNERYARRPWFDSTWMHEHGMLDHSELVSALRTCSWGLAPMSLFDDDPRYNRFSLPTKFVSYLAAGLPTVVVGHASSSLVQIGKRYRLGSCITSADPGVIASMLESTLSIKNPHARFRDEIERCARTVFNASEMRARLHRQLCGEDA